MKRILHISKYYHPFIGGVEQVASDCVNALKPNYEQKVICFNHEKGNKIDVLDGIEIIRVGCFAKIASQSLSFSYGRQLKKVVKSFKPDIVIFHYPNPFVGRYICKYFKKKTFKFILWWHLDITKQKLLGKLFEHQNQKLLRNSDCIVATSPNYIEGSNYLSKYKEKCSVIPCCVNEERLNYEEKHILMAQEIKQKYVGKTICFAFGRHVEYKGLTYLIKASKLLTDEFVVLIGGQGPLTASLKEEAKDDKKVEFLGRISDDELKTYLLACDIFCFPSITKNEAFGIGLAEAMFYGNPTVTFHIPGSGVNWVSINEETGLEVENRNVEKYAAAIESLANSNDKEKFANEAMKRAKSHFEQKHVFEKINQLIKDVI